MLDEFQYAIKHFVPTVPLKVKEEAQKIHKDLLADETADVETIKLAFHDIGKKEFPHRRAYDELTHTSAEAKMVEMVLDHVDEAVRAMIKPHLDSGVGLDDVVKSDLFEGKMTPEQRYQIEDGILVAKEKLGDALQSEVSEHSEEYKKLVEKWSANADEIEAKISELEAMSSQANENQKEEIHGKVMRYKEGFLLTEQDPDIKEIKKEIEYWEDTFNPEE